MFVCMCVFVSRKSAVEALSIAQLSFLAHLKSQLLVWLGVNSLGCHVILSYLFIAEMTPLQNHVFSLHSLDLWENHSRYRNNFNGLVLRNQVWAFQWHQNEPPTSPNFWTTEVLLDLHLIWDVKLGKSDFALSYVQTLLQSCSDQQLPTSKLFILMFEDNCEKNSKSVLIYAFY